MAGEARFGKVRLFPARFGSRGAPWYREVVQGEAWFGRLGFAGQVLVRRGLVRQGRYGAFGFGKARRDMVWYGLAVMACRGWVW